MPNLRTGHREFTVLHGQRSPWVTSQKVRRKNSTPRRWPSVGIIIMGLENPGFALWVFCLANIQAGLLPGDNKALHLSDLLESAMNSRTVSALIKGRATKK